MRVKDMIRSLMDKDPDDEVEIRVKASLYANNEKVTSVECDASVCDVMPGNTPVLLTANITMTAETTVEMF